jgi:hypothetical protein
MCCIVRYRPLFRPYTTAFCVCEVEHSGLLGFVADDDAVVAVQHRRKATLPLALAPPSHPRQGFCTKHKAQQDHYDFGMRAVKSVLVMAGSLKRANPQLSEDVVLIRAMRDSNLPKFLVRHGVVGSGKLRHDIDHDNCA